MIGIGVIGYGYWGPNLVRNFMETDGVTVRAICDRESKRQAIAKARCPSADVTGDAMAVLKHPGVDAVVIATPVSSHFELAMAALDAGKHVLVEKPMTTTSEQAKRLVEKAAAVGKTLMVDHTFIYTGAVRKMKELVSAGSIGDVLYYDSVRVNLGLFQHDVNVLWDLAPHDLSILQYLLDGERPRAVSALGMSHVPGQHENLAYLTLIYDRSFLAHLHVNWLAPVKVRRTLIGGAQKMIVYDELEGSEKVKVYDRGIDVESPSGPPSDKVYQALIGYRSGDMYAPKVDNTEALKIEAAHFRDCIVNGKAPITNGELGLQVVEMLEASMASMRHQGRPVKLGTLEVAT
jgi:predicted dehydrogenase